MNQKAHGQIRRSHVITTWGPGALLDLPRYAVIVGGLDTWPKRGDLEEIVEPRLTRKLQIMTGVAAPRLYAPPADANNPGEPKKGIGVWRFPEWFVVQEEAEGDERERSRRLVHRKGLDGRSRFDGRQVVPTRFVRACPKGHVDDLDWYRFVHGLEDTCHRQLWLDERGTSGDLADLVVRCECGKSRSLYEASMIELNPLGTCRVERPWLGRYASSCIRSRISCSSPSPCAVGIRRVRFGSGSMWIMRRRAQHAPGESMESRWLHGASCHGCALVAETSCEMRNDYLDRALIVSTLAVSDAAFFRETG